MTPMTENMGNAEAAAPAVLDAIDAIVAARGGVSHSQVALNWLLRRPGVSAVLVGARTDAQLADNLAAAQWSLLDEEMELAPVSKKRAKGKSDCSTKKKACNDCSCGRKELEEEHGAEEAKKKLEEGAVFIFFHPSI